MLRWQLLWRLMALLLVFSVSSCVSVDVIPPSPTALESAESKATSPTVIPSVQPTVTMESMGDIPTPVPTVTPSVVVEGKPTPPGGEQPWTPPPTFTLPDPQTSWQVHEFPEVGVRLQVPSEWTVWRDPGRYSIVVTGDGGYYEDRVHVTSCCDELPRTLPEFQEALGPYLQTLHAENAVIRPAQGQGWQGVAVWGQPYICLQVYIPTTDIVRLITFSPILCESDGEHLVPLGQRILDSVEIFPPRGEW